MRLAAYAGTSTALAVGVILRAFAQRANFYSAAVYLAQSSACLMILTNFLLLVVATLMLGLQRLLYGPLRPIEVEQLYEKGWFAVTETCLAMTIFREEVGAWFLVMLVSLLAGKVWGWIGDGRVEVLEQQPPANPRLFHLRLSSSLALSLLFDYLLLDYAIRTVLVQARPNMMVMFAFEFAILSITSTSTAARYAMQLYEAAMRRQQMKELVAERREELRERIRAQAQQESEGEPNVEPPTTTEIEVDEIELDPAGWQNKPQWLLALDLTTDFLKLIVYFCFFAILFSFYGLPIHILRDVFLTVRSFVKRINDFVKYRSATREMNQRYPDATAEELTRDDTCIICRDQMQPWVQEAAPDPPAPNAQVPARRAADESKRPKKFACGHIFHLGCVRSWLERHQHCPTCRRPVTAPATAPNPQTQPGATHNAVQQPNAQGGNNNNGPADPQRHVAANVGRIFNLGPVQIGFGVARGPANLNAEQILQNAIQNHQARLAAGVPAAIQGAPAPAQAPEGSEQTTDAVATIESQMAELESSLGRELNRLNTSHEYLRRARTLQSELAALRQRMASGAPINPNVPLEVNPSQELRFHQMVQQHHQQALHQHQQAMQQHLHRLIPQPHLHPVQQQGPLFPGQPQAFGNFQQFTPQPGQTPMRAGDQGLPEGMVLPAGYTLLPLVPQTHNPASNVTTHWQTTIQGQPRSYSAPRPPTAPATTPSTENTVDQGLRQTPPQDQSGLFTTPAPPDTHVPMALSRSARSHGTSSAVQVQPQPPMPNGSAVAGSLRHRPDHATNGSASLSPAKPGPSDLQSHPASDEGPSNDDGKGKGKAATVEDLPEEGV